MSDPFSERLNAAYRNLDQACLDAKPVEPRARVLPGDDEAFQRASDALQRQVLAGMGIPPAQEVRTPSGENTIWNDILNAYRLIEAAPSRRTEPIKLTKQQLAAIRAQQPERPAWDSGVVSPLFGVSIKLVDTVEESTPHQECMARVADLFDERRRQRDQVLAEHLAAADRWAWAFVAALVIAAVLVAIAGGMGWLA